MTEHVDVEILEPEPRSTANTAEIRAMVKIEELKLERTKFRSAALVMAIALLSWAAVCHATC